MRCNDCGRESRRAWWCTSLEVSRDVDKIGERAFPGVGQKRAEETRIAELERKIGQQVLEIDFLKRALQHVEQQRQLRARAGFYRRGVRFRSAPVELRDQVQRVALEWPTYGSRRITAELRRCGLPVNRKRVQRVMREDNLLGLRQRKFVATTDSAHGLKVYPNLAAALVVSGVKQLWRADITYSTPSQRSPPLWG